jgi:hypothetical protein
MVRHMPFSFADIPFVICLVIAALMPGIRNHMNKYILARDGVTYSLFRQREMLEHYRKLPGVNANYRFYCTSMIAVPVLIDGWVLLNRFFNTR